MIAAAARACRAAARSAGLPAAGDASACPAAAAGPHLAVRYGLAVACALAAAMLTLLLWQHVFIRNPFALFYAAVMLSAWYGGLGPGMLATVCSVLAIDTFLLPSFVTAMPGSQELVQVGIFGGVALLISYLNALRKRALGERDGMIALEHSAREEAEHARRRTALLADASDLLGASLDATAAVGDVARRAVPEFADACLVDLADPDGRTFRRIAAAVTPAPAAAAAPAGGPHEATRIIDPDAPGDADAAGDTQPRGDRESHGDGSTDAAGRPAAGTAHLLRAFDLAANAGGVARVIRTGRAEVVARASAESLADLAVREPSMAAFVEAGAASYLVAPLQAGGRTLGAISLISRDPGRPYGPHDLRLAEDLAGRLAAAIDHARLYREAQDANRMKDEFLAVVSHELRTPLNAILGWAQLLQQGMLDEPSASQGMSAIERNARAQARIIDDVLDVSRITQGKLRLDVKPTALRPIVADALDVVRPAADAKRITLHADLAGAGTGPEADRVVGDAERLRQVLWNLLSNAIKFTPDGGRVDVTLSRTGPRAAARANPAAPQAAQLVLRVRDSGKGIEPKFLPFVFDRFRQADSSSTRAHGGLGLGLAIVRHLVELHGGSIEAASDGPDRGAVFTVRLPAEHRSHPAAGPDRGSAAGADAQDVPHEHPELTGLRVLLVEDEPDAREMFSSMLEFCGADVMAVGSARDALAEFRHRRPDVLLSDIGMAGEDGYALIRQVRAIEDAVTSPGRSRPTPAMAITAFAGVADRVRALSAGYQMHVPKPIGSAAFTAAVAALARDAALVPPAAAPRFAPLPP